MTGDADEESEWRFSVAEFGSDEGDGPEKEGGNVAGRLDVDGVIEAEQIDLENALFVLVGVLLAVVFLAGFANLL